MGEASRQCRAIEQLTRFGTQADRKHRAHLFKVEGLFPVIEVMGAMGRVRAFIALTLLAGATRYFKGMQQSLDQNGQRRVGVFPLRSVFGTGSS